MRNSIVRSVSVLIAAIDLIYALVVLAFRAGSLFRAGHFALVTWLWCVLLIVNSLIILRALSHRTGGIEQDVTATTRA